ncbi:L,D-transpeptidase family protein [Jiella marina]|uniref:L,D-transpeptidase family protein n=1 Tax=Jiella sp. LLJ827 TaxID=2917712 RepID=UPI002101B8D7|nr:L,D-transpeptidase [Jiella sp. LLJ827]MCQ0988344.1 L,D-transpeptidase [Jiella sp. LLJ827]
MKTLAFGCMIAAAAWSAAGPALSAEPSAASREAEAPILLAQAYDNWPEGTVEVYEDQFGQRLFIDRNGRIIGVEGERNRFRRRSDDRGGEVIFGPPPPGAVLEGRVGEDPRGLRDRRQRDFDRPRTIDPYDDPVYDDRAFDDDPVQASLLPAPNDRRDDVGDVVREAELPRDSRSPATPGDDFGNGRLPSADPLPTEGQTIKETDPAPQIVAPSGKNARAEVAALQVLLDRAGMSPGVIDGRIGSNVNKAVAAYREKFGRTLPTGDAKALAEELDDTGGPAIVEYEITSEDVAGPYVAAIPSDYGEKAKLPALSFTRVSERLAEKFHMDEDYLKEINPGADFDRPGTRIKVANVGKNVTGEVKRIVADKGREQVRAYAADGTLLAAYPSTIGSADTPSPSGVVQVNRIAFDPNYTYNPKVNFKQGNNDKVLTIPPGPNGPVGTIWIALSKPTYGIHGTPEPSRIGKTNSHGCVRLTNWDAYELAKLVKPGVMVEFTE